ncbi:uncharacterized protein LOC134407051 isoform X2 [Elgaria multicarinata webbii]|uniref:uncharacterized protein LOC134407051 isoform X2 n=1 Tax=Elgaria multicarinata webbii TaxID=159646 RepID=UPI002FCD237D
MALEERDPGALIRNVLHLLLKHPEGVSFGDFTGAFYQLHGYHPHISLYGYRSLKHLVADMKNIVVVEGDSQRAVLKIANGFHFDHWLEGGGENGLDSSEGEAQSLTDVEKAGGDADVSACSTSGSTRGLVEEPASQAPDLSVAMVLIWEILERRPHGLKVTKLKEALREQYGFDLGRFSSYLGYEDVIPCLQDIPGLLLKNIKRTRNCVVQLQSLSCSPAPSLDSDFSACSSNSIPQGLTRKNSDSSSPIPSLDTSFSASNSNAVLKLITKKAAVLAEVLALVTSLLSRYKEGLRVTKMNEILLATEKLDLDQFSIAQGYRDTLEFLEHRMPELNIRYREDRLQCVVFFESASHGSTPSQFSASLSLVSEQSTRKSETVDKNVLVKKPVSCSSTPSQSSASLSLDSEQSASKSKNLNQNIMGKKPAPRSSMPSQSSAPISLDSEQSAIKSKNMNRNILGKKPAVLAEVLDLVTSLLAIYKEGLRVLKVNETLLATEKLNLEQFSVTQGYKDTLEFLEHRMPKLNIRYREDRLQCVVFLGSGKCKAKRKRRRTKAQKETTKKCPDRNSIPPLSNAPVQFLESSRMAEVVNSAPGLGAVSKVSFTFGDFSASSPHLQNLAVPAAFGSPPVENSSTSVPSAMVPNLPSFQPARSALADKNPSQSLPDVPPRLPSVPLFGGPPPAAEAPCPLGEVPPSESSLTKAQPPRDLNELERQVADILAAHPEGMSLFQFRAAYSAAYQQHLPLGNASSAKQRMLEMPNVVCVKGCGVQTLLLPVSAKVSPVKSGQPVFSKAENAAMLPGHPSLKTLAVAKSGAILEPSPIPKGLVVPQPRPVCVLAPDQCREPSDEDCGILPEGQSPRAPKPIAPWQEHGRARVNSVYRSVQPDLSEVATGAPGHSLPTSNPVVAPKSCLKCSVPKLPVPPPLLSLLQSSEYSSTKESHPFPKPLASVQQQVRTTHKQVWVPFAPQSPVVFPPDSQATRWGENAKSCGLESLPSPWISGNSAPSPSIPQPVPASFPAWAQPVVYPPVPLLPKMTKLPPLYTVPFLPVSGMPFGIQVQQTMQQNSHGVQLVPPIRLDQPVSLIQSDEQRKCIHTVPGQDPLSHGPSRTLQRAQSPAPAFSAGTFPVSSSSKSKASICTHKSQMVHHPECCNHTWLDDLQCSSFTVPDKSCTFIPSDRIPSKLPAPTDQRQYDDMNSLLTSPSKLPFSSQSVPTKASEPLTHVSSSIDRNSNVLPSDPSDFMHQRQYTSESPAVTTSSRRPANLLPSPLDSTTSPSYQLLHPSSINSSSGGLPSEPQTFMHQQQVISVSAAISSGTKPAHSPPSPQDSTTNPSRQPSCAPLNVAMDYGTSNQANPKNTISIPADSSSPSFSEEQMPYYSTPQNSPPPRSFDRCVIL